jgi:hypothetical protein
MVECLKECLKRFARINATQAKFRRELVLALAGRIALFWEGTLHGDERWSLEGHINLHSPLMNNTGKKKRVSGFLKQALVHEVYNARGSGVSSAYQLAVGMAAGREQGPSKKRAAVSQDSRRSKVRRAETATPWSESSCRNFITHHMFNYYLVTRRCLNYIFSFAAFRSFDFCSLGTSLCLFAFSFTPMYCMRGATTFRRRWAETFDSVGLALDAVDVNFRKTYTVAVCDPLTQWAAWLPPQVHSPLPVGDSYFQYVAYTSVAPSPILLQNWAGQNRF